MQSVSPRSLALDSLMACEKGGRYTNLEIESRLRNTALSSADKGLYTRLVYGVIERQITLDYIINRYAKTKTPDMEPVVRMALRMGIYQLYFMDRIPAFAAISETVDLVPRRSAGFVNAILRSFQRDGCTLELPTTENIEYYLSVKYSFPEELCGLYIADYGREVAEKILEAANKEPPIGLRVNTLRHAQTDAAVLLQGEAETTAVPGIFTAQVLTEKIRAGLENGDWFVQDPASRLCTLAVGARPGETVIDTCACPGGKSFSMGLDMMGQGILYSFDLHENKLSLIQKTGNRLGLDGLLQIRRCDAKTPEEALIGQGDRVLCDAPCSGLGVAAKKPEIRYKDLSSMENLPTVQKEVLHGAAAYVKLGGILVYSTCTIRKAENEEVVKAFLDSHPDFELTPFVLVSEISEEKVVADEGMLTLLPCDTVMGCQTDGFFIARMIRKNARKD